MANGISPPPGLARKVAALRVAFGIIWAIDAEFKWHPAFLTSYLQQVVAAGEGQPSWLAWLYSGAEHVIRIDPMGFAIATAVIESVIALGLILGFARRAGYVAGFGFSVLVWVFAEGFGGPYTAGTTDIGTGIIYAVVFAGLYGLDRYAGSSPYSLDAFIERRSSRWRLVAEASETRRD